MISDVCYFENNQMLSFVYWGSDVENPGYATNSGIYRFDIVSGSLKKAEYSSNGNNNYSSTYWLPIRFGDKINSTVKYEAGPLAMGCEGEGSCCIPNNTYEYNVVTNIVSYVSGECIETIPGE